MDIHIRKHCLMRDPVLFSLFPERNSDAASRELVLEVACDCAEDSGHSTYTPPFTTALWENCILSPENRTSTTVDVSNPSFLHQIYHNVAMSLSHSK